MKKNTLSLLLVPVFMVLFAFTASAGEFQGSVSTDYEYDDIYVEIGEYDYNVAYMKLVNESEGSIYIDPSSQVFYCDSNGNPVAVADTITDELVEIVPGDSWTYFTWELDDGVLISCQFCVLDSFNDIVTFGGAIVFQ